MTTRILVSESSRFSPAAAAQLQTIGEVTFADLDRAELLSAIEHVDAVWVRLRNQIDQEVLEAGRHLQVIASPTTGLNHIDLETADRRGVRVISLRGEVDFLREIRATAEHTIGLILSLLRRLPAATQHVTAGHWDRDLFCGREIHGKTIGIVGFGRLGRLVAKYLHAFDTRILAADPRIHQNDVPDYVEISSLNSLLKQSDIVTLHVNLCPSTASFFGREQFEQMRAGAWFVNTARGELVDETAMLDAMQSGKIAGAAVDVLCDERAGGMSDHPLVAYARQNPQLLITPHIGGCTTESMAKTEMFLAEKLCAVLQESSVTR
ncbi:D-3-phosphoglycerate dehydrogenase [Rhodopirellula maiorica SM1]|uniref:D-3-phosphoglycerate dehydrogenase n=1 Tax=Rhodopirellula maiorica SM1 TaxID=1265738 RepID=M5RQK1_9BACT|nr:NAD(P)-dependent oxidoreductase [Rhodopirellula maiorica]EMI17662.1 D-3-phosphoglycerate dehydrogenase [Rhodopirellula maiorica SM1]